MTHRRKFSALALAAAGVAVTALVGSGVASASTPYRAELQSEANRLVADGPPGAVILARNGRTTVTVSAGDGDLATDTPMRSVDRFHIGSLTKTYVATVVLQLVAEHRLTLDDPVSHWLPGLPTAPGYDWSKINVRALLQQTSGLRDYLNDPRFQTLDGLGSTWQPAQLVDIAVHLGPPLSGWNYANTNYVLAGMLVQAVTGQSVAHEIQARIIDPLGLSATSFPATSTRIPAPFAHGYFTPYGDVTQAVNPSSAGAAGATISNVDDISRFYQALFTGRLLPAAQLRELTDAIPVDDEGSLYAERYGLGIYEVHLPCGIAWGHDGGYPGGFKSFAYTSPDGRHQAALFYNDFGISDGTDNPTFRTAVQQATALAFCGSTNQ